jgi:hypothetical protein
MLHVRELTHIDIAPRKRLWFGWDNRWRTVLLYKITLPSNKQQNTTNIAAARKKKTHAR